MSCKEKRLSFVLIKYEERKRNLQFYNNVMFNEQKMLQRIEISWNLFRAIINMTKIPKIKGKEEKFWTKEIEFLIEKYWEKKKIWSDFQKPFFKRWLEFINKTRLIF